MNKNDWTPSSDPMKDLLAFIDEAQAASKLPPKPQYVTEAIAKWAELAMGERRVKSPYAPGSEMDKAWLKRWHEGHTP